MRKICPKLRLIFSYGLSNDLFLLIELYETSLTELSGKIGITMPNLSILKKGKARTIRFSTLDAICKVLDCQPGDILDYVCE